MKEQEKQSSKRGSDSEKENISMDAMLNELNEACPQLVDVINDKLEYCAAQDVPDHKEKSDSHEKVGTIIEVVKNDPANLYVKMGDAGADMKEGFENIKELASLLNGAVGASRAAVESEWIETSQLVGLTGKWISPTLYFTFGISGASQHLAGCINSKNIVSKYCAAS